MDWTTPAPTDLSGGSIIPAGTSTTVPLGCEQPETPEPDDDDEDDEPDDDEEEDDEDSNDSPERVE